MVRQAAIWQGAGIIAHPKGQNNLSGRFSVPLGGWLFSVIIADAPRQSLRLFDD